MTTIIPVVTVSQLNRQIRFYLENEIGIIHVEGEISNLSKPSSGHYYFTLKDASAQIKCAYFKNRHNTISKTLTDGQKIVANGRLSLYEARGDYQLIVDTITESGFGALYQQFEALKKKLAAEGLFDAHRKKPIPSYPATIAVITSHSGAALRDIISTLSRRYPLASVLVYHSEVQGFSAPIQLVNALHKAKKDARADVIIIARGGGSMEDLWAFNDEVLAREIASCSIPVVSGVGHETDFTITDFVADYRAETPTAAAEAVTPDWMELFAFFNTMVNRLHITMIKNLEHIRLQLLFLSEKIASPEQIIATQNQTLDYLANRLAQSMRAILSHKTHQIHNHMLQLSAQNPKVRVERMQVHLKQIPQTLTHHLQTLINQHNQQFTRILSTLHAVSPLATLDRGYAIASLHQKIIYSSEQVKQGDRINIRLSQGQLDCEIQQCTS